MKNVAVRFVPQSCTLGIFVFLPKAEFLNDFSLETCSKIVPKQLFLLILFCGIVLFSQKVSSQHLDNLISLASWKCSPMKSLKALVTGNSNTISLNPNGFQNYYHVWQDIKIEAGQIYHINLQAQSASNEAAVGYEFYDNSGQLLTKKITPITPSSTLQAHSFSAIKAPKNAVTARLVASTFGASLQLENISITQSAVSNNLFQELISIELYPNPSSTNVTVKIKKDNFTDTNITGLSVIGLDGSVHLSQTVSQTDEITISVQELNAGLYFVKLNQENGDTITKKLVVYH